MHTQALTNASAGFSLVELLIAMAVGLVILGAAYQSFITQRQTYAAQEQVTDMNQNARAALDFMTRELRMASTIGALDQTPGTSSITYISIEDPCQDRGFDLSSNTLRYYAHLVVRANCKDSTRRKPEPLAENIESLTISRAVNLFTITLITRTATRAPGRGDYRRITLTSNVRPRNLP